MPMMILGLGLLAAAALSDIRTKKVPYLMIAAAVCLSVVSGAVALYDNTMSLYELVSSLMPGALLLLMAWASRESLGYGDGLLMLSVGPLFGLRRMLFGVMLAFFITALLSIVLLVLRRVHRKTRIPFVPFLASAMGVVTFALG